MRGRGGCCRSARDDYITLSLGLATLAPGSDNSTEDLIALADTARYEAKARGRNQTTVKM
ncbi:MAG: GGDEF domain-containing protein [Proteobacteria bacterium]|nr:GGDEF domain-containing protein [Pseudomonadota bacterium]